MNSTAAAAAMSWMGTNAIAAGGSIPEKVSVKTRAMVTAGLANEVDAVKKQAEAMYPPTANATVVAGRRPRTHPRMIINNPAVAIASTRSGPGSSRSVGEMLRIDAPNIDSTPTAPTTPPATCTLAYLATSLQNNRSEDPFPEADGRVEMRSRRRTEGEDQRDQARSGGERIN